MPLVKVEVAEEVFRIEPPVIVKPLEERSPAAERPPAKVEVPEPSEYSKPVAVALPPKREFPATENLYAGVVVPMPTKPLLDSTISRGEDVP
jgi:hypothetical protein